MNKFTEARKCTELVQKAKGAWREPAALDAKELAGCSAGEREFLLCWAALEGPRLVREHQFLPDRKWRFDFAHVATQTAIEIEGGTWSGGRHTRGAGFVKDTEKYNAATAAGWSVFRLPTQKVVISELVKLRTFIGQRSLGLRGTLTDLLPEHLKAATRPHDPDPLD